MIIAGIDPGEKGAVAFIDDDGSLHVFDMPMLSTEPGAHVDHIALRNLLGDGNDLYPYFTVIEKPIPMPGQDCVASATRFTNYGILLGVIRTMGLSSQQKDPGEWKKAMGVSVRKNRGDSAYKHSKRLKALALEKAAELFPRFDFKGKDGWAEAALIAEYGRRTLTTPVTAKEGPIVGDCGIFCELDTLKPEVNNV